MRKSRILYVEDEIGAARMLKENLEATGRFEVAVQNWPEDALDTAHVFKPDLILLDIIMPRLPGGNVVELFEADQEMNEVPIVFFTAAVWDHQVQENDGIICEHPCLAKPSNLDDIIAFIERNLPEHCRTESLPEDPPTPTPIE